MRYTRFFPITSNLDNDKILENCKSMGLDSGFKKLYRKSLPGKKQDWYAKQNTVGWQIITDKALPELIEIIGNIQYINLTAKFHNYRHFTNGSR